MEIYTICEKTKNEQKKGCCQNIHTIIYKNGAGKP